MVGDGIDRIDDPKSNGFGICISHMHIWHFLEISPIHEHVSHEPHKNGDVDWSLWQRFYNSTMSVFVFLAKSGNFIWTFFLRHIWKPWIFLIKVLGFLSPRHRWRFHGENVKFLAGDFPKFCGLAFSEDDPCIHGNDVDWDFIVYMGHVPFPLINMQWNMARV